MERGLDKGLYGNVGIFINNFNYLIVVLAAKQFDLYK